MASVAYTVDQKPAVLTRPAAWAFSLRWWLVTVALILIALRMGYAIGYWQGYQEGPFRLKPGAPDNWTAPLEPGRIVPRKR